MRVALPLSFGNDSLGLEHCKTLSTKTFVALWTRNLYLHLQSRST